MKKISTLLALLLMTLAFSQEKTYTIAMDSLLSHVDKSTMTTGILYDRIFPISDLQTNTSPTISYDYFMQSWNELYTASISPAFLSADTLQEKVNLNKQVNKVIVGVINLKMNYLDYGTASDPKLTFSNGYFWNVPGKNPFLEKNISIVQPLSSEIENDAVTYVIKKEFFAEDSHSVPISSLQIDFGDGVSHTYNVSGNFAPIEQTVQYSSAGLKTVNLQINYSDTTIQSLQSTVKVSFSENSVAKLAGNFNEFENFTYGNGITQTIPFKGYNETIATSGKLEYRTYYNRVSNPGYNPADHSFSIQPKLRKPVIILDGFDPGDSRNLDRLNQLMTYDHDNNTTTPPKRLVEDLQNLGYDVTLVNFQNGADFIERNAMALVALLQRENSKLSANGSTEQITIIGPSMGGLVSRYALAYMEKNNMPHNTKLWVSFDSPHLGANIPISTQRNLYFYGFIGGAQQAKTKYIENFRSPAARQMLIEQLDAYPVSTSYYATQGMNNNAPFRQQFLQNLTTNGLANSNGFPQNLRKIAITNGTTNGAKTNNETDCILEMAAFKNFLGGKIKVATLVDYNLAKPNNSFLNFEGRYTTTGFLSVTVYNSKITLLNGNPRGSMDVVQGGTFNTQGILKDEFTPVLNADTSFHEWRQYRPNHAFIPTVSSLAFKNSNFDWNTDISRNLLCNNEIPFDTYFIPPTNQPHIDITSDLVTWLTNEINGIPQAPHLNLNNVLLSSDKTLMCNNETAFVSTNITNLCALPSNYFWSTNNNLQIIGSSTNNSVQISAISEGLGVVYLNFANGQQVAQKIWIGKPQIYMDQNFTNYPGRVSVTLKSMVPAVTIQEQGINPNTIVWRRPDMNITKTGGLTYYFMGSSLPPLDGYPVEVTATNICGSTTELGYFEPDSANCGYNIAKTSGDSYNIIDPCPPGPITGAYTTTTMSSTSSGSSNPKLQNLTTKVYNSMGSQVLSTNSLQFSLSGLMTGTYYVKIFQNGNIVHTQTLLKN